MGGRRPERAQKFPFVSSQGKHDLQTPVAATQRALTPESRGRRAFPLSYICPLLPVTVPLRIEPHTGHHFICLDLQAELLEGVSLLKK